MDKAPSLTVKCMCYAELIAAHTVLWKSFQVSVISYIDCRSVKSDLFSTKSFDLRGKQFNHVEAHFSPATSNTL